MQRLIRRVRWKRWLGKLHRFAWLLAATFLFLFVADSLFGMRTLGLRVASGIAFLLAVTLFTVDWIMAWLVRLDRVGLAQLLEKRYPELAERLVTLVQLQAEEAPSRFIPLLQGETEQKLVGVDPNEACPLSSERKAWTRTAVVLAIVFVGLYFVPSFGIFSYRFFGAWATPLIPFTIEVVQGNGYALRGGNWEVRTKYHMLDDRAEAPTEWELVCKDDMGATTILAMKATTDGHFAAVLKNLRHPLHCRVQAGEGVSPTFEVRLIDPPLFTAKPALIVSPPKYLAKNGPRMMVLDESNDEKFDILRFSKMYLQFILNRPPARAWLKVKTLSASEKNNTTASMLAVQWKQGAVTGTVDEIAATVGVYQAELVMELEHGLSTTLPLGQWTVHDDGAPRFTQSLRLRGGGAALLANQEYRISPGDVLKLQTTLEDDEGLETIFFEYRINDDEPRLEKWLNAAGKKNLIIDDWLPLPSTLKEMDRVQFRIHASDNRRLKKGEALKGKGQPFLPSEDLLPHVTIAPSAFAGEAAWITLRVDRSVEGLLKQQAQAQSEEVRDVIGKIKQKLQTETEQVQQMQRTIHQQAAPTTAQLKQAEKLRALNREIAEDLLAAGERFGANPELAKLAEHFLDIAENEMMKSAEALQRFSDKERPLAEGEKELQVSQGALMQARKKLERMLDWNKLLTQDRLDQFQIEKLLKRQNELAQRLEKLLADEPMSDAEMANQIENIRREQAKIAEQTAQLREQSRLAQDSMESLQQKRVQRLAQEAQQLAAEQREMRENVADKLPPELKERLDKLAQRQADLAQRVQPFAQKNQGPDLKPAADAANALKKPRIDEAIQQQKEHEKRIQAWLGKLVPEGTSNSLREQILQLAKKQQAIRGDLDRLVQEAPQLEFEVLQKRLRELTARQKELPPAIAKLPIDGKDERLRLAQKGAERTTQQAGDQLALENATGAPAAHKSMNKAQQELEALAGMIPKGQPTDRGQIKDAALRAKVEQVDEFARGQEKIRAETERLRDDAAKASAGARKHGLAERMDKLASDLMELAQKGTGPEAKAMAKESAQAVEAAKKAIDAGQAMKANGDADQAKMLDENAEKQLDLAVKQLTKFAQDRAMKDMAKPDDPNVAEALKNSGEQMRQAEEKLPTMPKGSQAAMKSAAKSLEQAAQQAGKQSASQLPKAARNPAGQSPKPMAGTFPPSVPKEMKLETLQGKAWGELPGELKTKMLQDVRARFGEEYAELIRHYFDSLAETPRTGRKE